MDQSTERWMPVVGYEGHYEVSDLGRVRSLQRLGIRGQRVRERYLVVTPNLNGYLRVALYRGGQSRSFNVHTLVATAFLGPRPDGHEVCHKDNDRANPAASNLRWGTRSSNLLDVVRAGHHQHASKTHCPRGHVLDVPNLVRSQLAAGRRDCLACARTRPLTKDRSGIFKKIADEKYRTIMSY